MTDTNLSRDEQLDNFAEELLFSGCVDDFIEALFVRAEAGLDETKENVTVVIRVPVETVLEAWRKKDERFDA